MKSITHIGWVLCSLILIVSGTFWTGCEETLSGTEVKIPYREELVVQGLLTAGQESDTILIMRTLPPLEKWSLSRAALTDAVATITSEGVEYPLVHVGSGRYRTVGLEPVVGKSYLLRVGWNGLSVEAIASIPQEPELLGLTFDTVKGGCDFDNHGDESPSIDEMHIVVEYMPHGSSVNSARLGLSYTYNNGFPNREEGFSYFFYDIDSSGTTNKASIYSQCLFDEGGVGLEIDTLFLHLTEYEEAFTSYFNTRYVGNDEDLFFGTGGEQPLWNVKGDGFGWFFGRSTRDDVIALQ